MSIDSDLGYDLSSTTWTYLSPRLRQKTVSFAAEVSNAGAVAVQMLNAAKRLYNHSRPSTIENVVKIVRTLINAIARYAPPIPSILDCEEALVRELKTAASREGTSHNSYKIAAAVLAEAARHHGIAFRARNPFRRVSTPIRTAPRDELRQLLICARNDAISYHRDFTDPSSWQHPSVVLAAREFASKSGGTLPRQDLATPISIEYSKFLARAERETGVRYNTRLLSRYCYATYETLIPFYTLLIHKLAANVDAVALMGRDCMQEIDNPLLGRRFLVALPKGRSPGMPPYSVSDYGQLSVPWLIRALLALSEPLVPHAAPPYRQYLFLAYSRLGSVLPLMTLRPSAAFRHYKKSRGITSAIALNMLRPTRLVDEYERSLDPFRVRQIAQHRNLSDTMRYLDHSEAAATDELTIANAQSTILLGRTITDKASGNRETRSATTPSHVCLDPAASHDGHDANGLCANLLWPLNDRHFVMRLEPRSVAFLLRDYEALCEAQQRIPSERYRRLYLPKRRLIEAQYLPAIDAALLNAAQQIATTLPPPPRID
ncbi:MAG TPA: hypothetical protein VMF11_14815 [Candidatus Baltobacteraceae bacterium]|nr:hypothetical protein [Candidatus Baltobacteraceae bacterium]